MLSKITSDVQNGGILLIEANFSWKTDVLSWPNNQNLATLCE